MSIKERGGDKLAEKLLLNILMPLIQWLSVDTVALLKRQEFLDRAFTVLYPTDITTIFLAQEVGVPVSLRLGGRLAMTLVATIKDIIFSFFLFSSCPSSTLLIEGVLESKTYLARAPKNLGVEPTGHFGFFNHFGIAGGERVTQAPLGWYCCCLHIFEVVSIFGVQVVLNKL